MSNLQSPKPQTHGRECHVVNHGSGSGLCRLAEVANFEFKYLNNFLVAPAARYGMQTVTV